MIWHDLSHHVVVLAAVSTNGARALKTRRAGKIGLSGGAEQKNGARDESFCRRKREWTAHVFFNYSPDNNHCVVYTSPPPAAEPLLKEKPF